MRPPDGCVEDVDRCLGRETHRRAIGQRHTAWQPCQERHVAGGAGRHRVSAKIFGMPNARWYPLFGEMKILRPYTANAIGL